MKQIFFSLLIPVLFASNVLAQTSAITLVSPYTGLDVDQGKVLNYVNNIPRNGTLKYVNWASQDQIVNNSTIAVTLPNENNGQPIYFELLDADFASTTEYAIYGRGSLGNISLYVTPQGIGGTIDLVSKVYAAFPLGGTKGTLIELAQTGNETAVCGTDAISREAEANYCDEDCGRAVLDVLALVTPGARQWAADNWGWLGQWFLFVETHNINGAFINSLVPNKRVRVRIIDYTPDFNLTGLIGPDLLSLRNSITANQLAIQNGSDIRMLLTEIDYPGIAGAIPSDQGAPTTTNKVGIVEVPFIGPIRYTFAHEVAHHFGCWHSTPTISGCPNGISMTNGRNTIMANGTPASPFAPDNTRIQHFSNPDVLFGGLPTGVAGTRDNAAQIRGAFCEVANNLPDQYSAQISKNTVGPICEGETHTFGADVFAGICQDPFTLIFSDCATGPYQYEWRISNSPAFNNSQVIGNAQSVTFTIQYCPFYLRVTVVSANGLTTTSTRLYNCAPGVVCNGFAPNPTDRSSKNATGDPSNLRCVPNPANDQLKVLYNGAGTITKVTVIDVTGNIKAIRNLSSNQGEITLDISDLGQGLWFLHVQGTQTEQTIKFSIIR